MRKKHSRVRNCLIALGCFAAALALLPAGPSPAVAEVQKHDAASLAIGKVAPEIEGEDVDGKKFKLSDYRGKVVVLDFWGDW